MQRKALSLVLLACACGGAEQPSRLQQLEAGKTAPPEVPEVPADAAGAGRPDGKTDGSAGPAPTGPEGQVVGAPPPGAETATLRLSLQEGATYKVTTVGNVQFGSLVQGTAWAREERLRLAQCAGEGFARACTLEHRYVHFEAEPPNGRLLENDEKAVSGLVTRHKLKATGERVGATEIAEGPKEQVDSAAGKALADVDRFFCVRFPDQPIAVGAKWRATCHVRSGGVVDTRDVLWELEKLERDPDTGLRAELSYLGKYKAPGVKGSLEGVISGVMYFFVDAGEPHLIREQFTMQTDAASQFVTHTSVAVQFAKLTKGPDGKETAVRVDGKPFPPGEAINAPKPEPPPGAPPAGAGAPGQPGTVDGKAGAGGG